MGDHKQETRPGRFGSAAGRPVVSICNHSRRVQLAETLDQEVNTERESLPITGRDLADTGGNHAHAVVLEPLLLVRDVTKNEMQKRRSCPRTRPGIKPSLERNTQPRQWRRSTKAERERARHHFCAIPVGEQRVTQTKRLSRSRLIPLDFRGSARAGAISNTLG